METDRIIDAGPGLETALNGLAARRPVGIQQALDRLDELERQAPLAEILRELAPEHLPGTSLDELYSQVIRAIEPRAPLWEMMDSVDDYVIYPDPHGYAIGWDDWEQMSDDAGVVVEHMRLYLFYTCIRLDDETAFNTAAHAYGWGCEFCDFRNLDLDQLKIVLAEAGLAEFYTALRVAWYDTDNLFFDWDPFDEESYDFHLPALDLEGVAWLVRDWEAAQPIIAEEQTACERFAAEPGLAATLLDCMLRCSEQPTPVRPDQPLLEVFAVEDEEGDDDDQIEQRVQVRL